MLIKLSYHHHKLKMHLNIIIGRNHTGVPVREVFLWYCYMNVWEYSSV